jgi:hypothetical protein
MANTTSSKTGVVATDVVTFNIQNSGEGMIVYVKYDKGNGTSATITFTVLNKNLHATDTYNYWDSTSLTVALETFTFSTTGNFRIPLAVAMDETSLIATVAYTGGTTQTMCVDAQFGT